MRNALLLLLLAGVAFGQDAPDPGFAVYPEEGGNAVGVSPAPPVAPACVCYDETMMPDAMETCYGTASPIWQTTCSLLTVDKYCFHTCGDSPPVNYWVGLSYDDTLPWGHCQRQVDINNGAFPQTAYTTEFDKAICDQHLIDFSEVQHMYNVGGWPMNEAGTTDDRADTTDGVNCTAGVPIQPGLNCYEHNDLLYESDTCTQTAAHLGDGTRGTNACNLRSADWFDAGESKPEATYIFWTSRETAGTPSVKAIFTEGSDNEMFALITADSPGTIASFTVKGYPGPSSANPSSQTCPVSAAWCFWALVIDGETVTMYMGDDNGTALSSTTANLGSGDLAREGDFFDMNIGTITIDDWKYFQRAIGPDELEEFHYNSGNGVPVDNF